MMEKGINTPYTSSAGRLFDAVASLLDICDISTHQAEAPVRLEQTASGELSRHYPVRIENGYISFRPAFDAMLEELAEGIPVAGISASFHNTIASALVECIRQQKEQTGISTVVLSGGCFQNKRLSEQLQQLLAKERITCYLPGRIPCNDGGISVGQLAVAASRQEVLQM